MVVRMVATGPRPGDTKHNAPRTRRAQQTNEKAFFFSFAVQRGKTAIDEARDSGGAALFALMCGVAARGDLAMLKTAIKGQWKDVDAISFDEVR